MNDMMPDLLPQTHQFLERQHGFLIDGRWTQPGDGAAIGVLDPATGRTIAHCAAGGKREIDAAVASARRALEQSWSGFTAAERGKTIWRLAELIEMHAQEIIELEVLDNGLPATLARGICTRFAPDFLRYYAGWATKIEGSTIPASPQGKLPGEALTFTLREPIGVVGAITPWNQPLSMAILKIAPALAAGCTIVLKPAELTPLSTMRLGELCLEAGIPPGVVNIVNGRGEEAGAALAAHPGVDKISFTGSTAVGKKIIAAATGNLKKVTLELGGKSPVVVFQDADMDEVVPGIIRACFFLQGQNCMAGTRLFVHEQLRDRVVEEVVRAAKNLHIGSGFDPATDFGPLISDEQRTRVSELVTAGIREGAEIAYGGHALARPGFFYEPTIIVGARPEMTPVKNEIFGPVLCVQAFGDEDLEDLARNVNATTYGLSGSVWTRDIGRAMQWVRQIDSGQVSVNMHPAIDPAVPFGGNKQSGWGREFGREGLEPYLKTKGVTLTW